MSKPPFVLIKDIAQSPIKPDKICSQDKQSKQLKFIPPPLCEEDVSFKETLNNCIDLLKKFVWMSESEAIVISLWVASTWFVDSLDLVPYLLITSKTKACGKTKLLEFLERLVRFPIKAGDCTSASVFRLMDQGSPTLLMDEVDQYLKDRDGFSSILNNGNTRSGKVFRSASNINGGFSDNVKTYNCFGFKAIAGIKSEQLYDTLTSRSIVIYLMRKPENLANKKRIKFKQHEEEFKSIRQRFYTLSIRFGEEVRKLTDSGEIEFPNEFNDRQIDCYEPIWAMLECMADGNTQRICKNACQMCLTSTLSPELRLLHIVYEIVKKNKQDWITTSKLIKELNNMPDYIELSCTKLSRNLATFDIKPKQLSQENNKRGYLTVQLKRACSGYR